MRLRSLLAIQILSFTLASSGFAGWNATRSGTYIYKVSDPGQNLSLIALEVYGKSSHWHQIAQWNNLEAPYRIRIGQKLVLEQAPTLSHEQGASALLAFYRKKLGLEGQPEVANKTQEPKQMAEIPVTTQAIQEPRTLVKAETEFHKKSFRAAFRNIEAFTQRSQTITTDRAPASVAPPENVYKRLEQSNLTWYEGQTADQIYQTMSQVKETQTQYESRKCSQKQGENLICIRCPASSSAQSENTRCAGFFN